MDSYERARSIGKNWQAAYISERETDMKALMRDSVVQAIPYTSVNAKVNSFTAETVERLESERLKSMVRSTFPKFAGRVYMKWLTIYGTYALGLAFRKVATAKGNAIPVEYNRALESLPRAHNRAVPNGVYNKEYEERVNERIDEIVKMHAKSDYSERLTVRAQAERELRAEWHEEQLSGLREKGVNFVWINSHANCSERCQPWQGKLYSLNGTSGTLDGVSYQPLENATDIYDTTKSGKTYKNGCISGFNCRHKLVEYKKGFRPEEIPEAVTKRESEIEKKQRYYENIVRHYECSAEMAEGTKKAKAHKKLAAKWRKDYIAFCKENNVPYYPSRFK